MIQSIHCYQKILNKDKLEDIKRIHTLLVPTYLCVLQSVDLHDRFATKPFAPMATQANENTHSQNLENQTPINDENKKSQAVELQLIFQNTRITSRISAK